MRQFLEFLLERFHLGCLLRFECCGFARSFALERFALRASTIVEALECFFHRAVHRGLRHERSRARRAMEYDAFLEQPIRNRPWLVAILADDRNFPRERIKLRARY